MGIAFDSDSIPSDMQHNEFSIINSVEELESILQKHIDYLKDIQTQRERCAKENICFTYTSGANYKVYLNNEIFFINWSMKADLGTMAITLDFENPTDKPSTILKFFEEARKNKVFLRVFGADGLKYFEKSGHRYALTFAYNAKHCPSHYNRKSYINNKISDIKDYGTAIQKIKLKLNKKKVLANIEKEAPIIVPNKNCYLNKMPFTQMPQLFEKYSNKQNKPSQEL